MSPSDAELTLNHGVTYVVVSAKGKAINVLPPIIDKIDLVVSYVDLFGHGNTIWAFFIAATQFGLNVKTHVKFLLFAFRATLFRFRARIKMEDSSIVDLNSF